MSDSLGNDHIHAYKLSCLRDTVARAVDLLVAVERDLSYIEHVADRRDEKKDYAVDTLTFRKQRAKDAIRDIESELDAIVRFESKHGITSNSREDLEDTIADLLRWKEDGSSLPLK